MAAQPQPLTDDFRRYEALLWRVLSALARKGYFVPPGDARDLLHDFYLEAWPGLHERFDPRLSSFGTYIAAAFYRFARRRIVRLDHWRRRLVDVEELADLPADTQPPASAAERSELIDAVRRALATLPQLEREMLDGYLADERLPERVLAERHSLSRYAVREVLVNAVGHVAVALREFGEQSTDSIVAVNLWRDGRSIKDVALRLGISVAEVQACKTRVAAQLLANLRSFNSERSAGGSIMNNDLFAKFKTALLAKDSNEVHRFAERHIDELKDAFDRDEDELKFTVREEALLRSEPERLAIVYALLGGDEAADEEPSDIALALAAARGDAAREIGEAFAAMVDLLPPEFHNWSQWFESTDPALVRHLQQGTSVEHGGPQAQELVKYGLTPMIFCEATRALQLLFDRVARSDGGFVDSVRQAEEIDEFGMRLILPSGRGLVVDGGLLLAQLSAVPDLQQEIAASLLSWVFAALELHPYLIRGFHAIRHYGQDPTLVKLELPVVAADELDLMALWTRRAVEATAHVDMTTAARFEQSR